MNLMPLQKLGAREAAPGIIQFGVYFPWVSAQDGNRLFVKVIHEHDQFLQDIQPLSFEMAHSSDPVYGDYWSGQVDLLNTPAPAGSTFGQPGTYVYRYELHNPNAGVLDWIVDPFAREFGTGKLSAFSWPYQEHAWSAAEAQWKTPALKDLIVYELQLEEFAGGVDGTIARLDYLADLGINCIEVMPVSNVSLDIDWGYLPNGYFGVDERFGNRTDFQRLVDAAHQRGIAVVIDAVYGHTSDSFAYWDLYTRLNYNENPFMGKFAKQYFGQTVDFARQIAMDYFFSVNQFWLERFHIDGFRYDCVPEYWDGPVGKGYSKLVYDTYQAVKDCIDEPYWQRFASGSRVNLVQCAENLEEPQTVLNQSYSTSVWQNGSLGAAQAISKGNFGSLYDLAFAWGASGYQSEVTNNGDIIAKRPFQYIENHDWERFVCNFGLTGTDVPLLAAGDRSRWYKIQPYLIGLLTSKGTPLLWQGQEVGENYWIPSDGIGRVMLLRPVHWDFFYDPVGKLAIGLVRRLIQLRRQNPEFSEGEHYFFNNWEAYQSQGVMLFARYTGSHYSLVALNFSDQDAVVPFAFPRPGQYEELLHGQAQDHLSVLNVDLPVQLHVPSNYGRVWRLVS